MDLQLPGHAEMVLRQRYEIASIVNDLLIALWFTLGSILFFQESTATAGTWLFLVGSIQLAIRPSIRLTRRLHLRRHTGGRRPHESDDDY